MTISMDTYYLYGFCFNDIPFLLEAAAVLATFVRPNHIVIYAHGGSLTCRLPATPSSLGI
ncbi:hypothetical protein C1O25_11400 [Vibrio diazotrophicus]|uniref:DUF3265 domain-containing protein n=1 Tax=Vibrio diazotrophicus TaxID=685 RepID=A0ABX4W9V4_VIBDI|nr:hypothetical protein C1O25_11400 [Vibrio diazotrophicus]